MGPARKIAGLLVAIALAGCAGRSRSILLPPTGAPSLNLDSRPAPPKEPGGITLGPPVSSDPVPNPAPAPAPPPDWQSNRQPSAPPQEPWPDRPAGAPKLRVGLDGTRTASPGDRVPLEVAVANTGTAPATNVKLRAELDVGLKHDAGLQILEVSVGTLAAGQSTSIPLTLTAAQAGKPAVHVVGTADGNLRDETARAVIVQERALLFRITGGPTRYINRPGTWDVQVANTGEAGLSGVTARVRLPHELRFQSATGGGHQIAGEVVWTIGDLRPGERRELKVTATPLSGVGQATVTGTATADKLPPQTAEATFEVLGMPVLHADVVPPSTAIAAGGAGIVVVRISNQGTLAAQNVFIAATTTPQFLTPRFGGGPTVGRVQGERIEFAPVARVEAGQTVTFQIDVAGAQPGDGRMKVEVRSDMTPAPLTVEEAIRISPPVATPGRQLPSSMPR
jgi:uncharacterized repeat protein (TIGR01451 family)